MSAGTETPTTPPSTSSTTSQRTSRHLQLVPCASPSSPVEAADARRSRTQGRVRDAITLAPSARALRRAVQAHGLAIGQPVQADALSIVLAAKIANHVVPVSLFTEDMVWQLLWTDVFTWCATRRQEVPQDVAQTLWAVLSFLAETNSFHPDSDPLTQLRSPLMTSAGLGPDGSLRHPTGRRNA